VLDYAQRGALDLSPNLRPRAALLLHLQASPPAASTLAK
jgi:hypothetical protein